jgi:hypothetical protein
MSREMTAMMHLRRLIRKYEDLERPNLDAEHAIWEVHAAKLMGFFLGLMIAALFPRISDISWTVFGAAAAICAAYPGAMAIRRMTRTRRAGRA